MKIACSRTFAIDIFKNPFNLVRFHTQRRCHLFRWYAIIFAEKAQIHLVIREREIEFILPLREGIGVGGGFPLSYLFRNAEEFR